MAMVEVHPADNETAKRLAQPYGEFSDARAMTMSRAGEDLGWILYRVDRDRMELIALYSAEEPLEELLVRAALNDAVNALAIDAVCRNPAHFALLERLGFTAEGDGYTIFIPSFFMRPCNGCHGG